VKKKFNAIILFLLCISLLFGPVFANAADPNSVLKDEDSIKIVEDSKGDGERLELSPISDGYLESQKAGNIASPLNINFNHMKVGFRSMPEYVPARYDLREENRVSPVRSQGPNGSCWAFATYGSMESVLAKYGKYDFSEKHLRNTHDFDWGPNDGGNRDIATAYLASWKGPVREADDPYDPVISFSPQGLVRSMEIDKVMYLPDVVSESDARNLKLAIMKYGGVYTVVNSSKYYENERNNSFYNAHGGPADHAVTIVGWDDNFSKNKFTAKPQNNGAWICKNSWGTDYMDNGYYYVSYEDVHIGTSNAVFIAKNMDPEGKIYQYDPLGATRSVGYNKKGFMANVFKAKDSETLHEVGLYNVSMDTDYKIYLVKNIKKTSQLSSDRVEIASGTIEYPGYYTIDVGSHKLDKNEQFAIVVYMDSTRSNYRYPLPIEAAIKNYSSKATSNEGESFVSPTGESWTDLYTEVKNANACVKAITTTGEVPKNDEIVPEDPNVDVIKEPNDVVFNEGENGFIRVNNIGKLSTKVLPEGFEDTPVKLFTPNSDVIKVGEDGKITPLKTGDANIYAEIQTSKGVYRRRFYLKVIPKDIRFDLMPEIPIIGEQDVDSGDYIPPKPGDDDYPTPPKPDIDETLPRFLSVTVPSITLNEGDDFDLSQKINIYPTTATQKELRYSSSDDDVVSVSRDGIITAKSIGKASVRVMTVNNISKEVNVNVLPKFDEKELQITDIEISDRSAGIFTVTLRAEENGVGYSGPAIITTIADYEDDKPITRENRVYFNRGEATIKYNGGQFGVWRTNFKTDVKIRDRASSITYEFSKKSKSPANIINVEGVINK
jgi:C1A family cysteine protease